MTDLDESYTGIDVDDDFNNAMSTETLADRDLVTPAFDSTPRTRTECLQIETFQHRRYLKVEGSATLRKGAKISKVWNYGAEYRALGAANILEATECLKA